MKSLLIYNDQPLSYHCQTAAYVANGHAAPEWKHLGLEGDCCCQVYDPYSSETYVDPTDAWWYDPTDPGSGEYLGAVIDTIELGAAYERPTSETLTGLYIGGRRRLGREVTIEGWVVASSERGTQWGIDFLNARFSREACGEKPCLKPDLIWSAYCADSGDQIRRLRSVEALSTLQIIDEDIHRSAGVRFSIVLASENSYIYQDPETLLLASPFGSTVYANWCCPVCMAPGIEWPDCGAIPESAERVTVPDESWVESTNSSCFCTPIFGFKKEVVIAGSNQFATHVNWEIVAPVNLTNITVNLYSKQGSGSPLTNSGDYTCDALLGSSEISFIPAGHTLRYVSGNSTIELTNTATGDRVDPVAIGALTPALMECPDGYLVFTVDERNTMAGVTVSVESEVATL